MAFIEPMHHNQTQSKVICFWVFSCSRQLCNRFCLSFLFCLSQLRFCFMVLCIFDWFASYLAQIQPLRRRCVAHHFQVKRSHKYRSTVGLWLLRCAMCRSYWIPRSTYRYFLPCRVHLLTLGDAERRRDPTNLSVTADYLQTTVLPKLVQWSACKDINTDQSSLRLVDLRRYNELYQEIKTKHGLNLVQVGRKFCRWYLEIIAQCHYNTVNFLPNPHNKYPLAHLFWRGIGCFVGVNSDVNSASVTIVLYAIIGPRYNGTWL